MCAAAADDRDRLRALQQRRGLCINTLPSPAAADGSAEEVLPLRQALQRRPRSADETI